MISSEDDDWYDDPLLIDDKEFCYGGDQAFLKSGKCIEEISSIIKNKFQDQEVESFFVAGNLNVLAMLQMISLTAKLSKINHRENNDEINEITDHLRFRYFFCRLFLNTPSLARGIYLDHKKL
jgi:hypothetical protein